MAAAITIRLLNTMHSLSCTSRLNGLEYGRSFGAMSNLCPHFFACVFSDDLPPMAVQQPLGSMLEERIAWPIHAHGDFGSEPLVLLPRGTFPTPEQSSEECFSPVEFDMGQYPLK